MQAELSTLFESNYLRAIDKEFGRFIQQHLNENDPLVGLAILVSFELGRGNVCVDLEKIDKASLFGLNKDNATFISAWLGLMDLPSLRENLRQSLVVSKGDRATPLVFDGNRLYLHRCWQNEQTVAKQIRQRAIEIELPANTATVLDSLFTPAASEIDWQKVAAAAAISYGFSVISGGPGTGKTTTVAKLLAALVQTSSSVPVIKLVAPTGKAANRLTESITSAVASLNVSNDIKAHIPKQASTIHRLLGVVPNRVEFRHHKNNPLHLDVLVVDEASMVDLSMMATLLNALPSKARLILLGDKDQLASVEAGAVLGDICAFAFHGFSQSRAKKLQNLTGFSLDFNQQQNPIADAVCLLRKSYRFDENSGIGQLAHAINAGDMRKVEKVWADDFADISLHELDEQGYQKAIDQAFTGHKDYLQALKKNEDHKSILKKFAEFRLLCALNEGSFGISGLNLAIENRLIQSKLIQVGEEKFYVGRPILIKQNDHGLGIYNGDIGIVVEAKEGRRVIFEMPDGSIKAFLPTRLPKHQTAYVMNVHKSQGSEFAHTVILLPPEINPVLTRELVYTAVTRAKKRLDVYANKNVFNQAVKRKTERFSGLNHALTIG